MEAFSSLQAALDCSLVPTHFAVKDPKMCAGCGAIFCGECLKKCRKAREAKIKCAFCRKAAYFADYVSLPWHKDANDLVKGLQSEFSQKLGRISFLEMENKQLRKRIRDLTSKPAAGRGKRPSDQPTINSVLPVTDHTRTTKTKKIAEQKEGGNDQTGSQTTNRPWTRSMGARDHTSLSYSQSTDEETQAEDINRPGPSSRCISEGKKTINLD
ncbi:Oidioi.mRNA.OKI2018_I69.chr1.g3562.t1.cds [Oikopleura dioica]|uniref:Oidioi.mRNA.OKI2018_I69.chr1.g3562.t1.cds n=1 Tax=Oikopleura dioica TaxID=34765 RepID=A0ABN7SY20_OIKDI|nr:Oidioi.mRNA.OKI2018_I69.chr1.g3562.t1.cds [Oikopleura dioica]